MWGIRTVEVTPYVIVHVCLLMSANNITSLSYIFHWLEFVVIIQFLDLMQNVESSLFSMMVRILHNFTSLAFVVWAVSCWLWVDTCSLVKQFSYGNQGTHWSCCSSYWFLSKISTHVPTIISLKWRFTCKSHGPWVFTHVSWCTREARAYFVFLLA